jgi:hypothetical protein
MCVYKYHAFIYFLCPPPWSRTDSKQQNLMWSSLCSYIPWFTNQCLCMYSSNRQILLYSPCSTFMYYSWRIDHCSFMPISNRFCCEAHCPCMLISNRFCCTAHCSCISVSNRSRCIAHCICIFFNKHWCMAHCSCTSVRHSSWCV